VCRWAVARSDPSSQKPLQCCRRTNIAWSMYSVFCLTKKREPNADQDSFMFDKIMPLSEAVEGYDLFDSMKVQKVIFEP
jgi:hypothetical protein